jgi:hypothetical protein
VAYTLILHVQNYGKIIGEADALPSPSDRLILLQNPRHLDGRDLENLEENVFAVFYPVNTLTLIEVLAGEEEEAIIGFVRE